MFTCRACARRVTATLLRPGVAADLALRPSPRLLSTTPNLRQQATVFAELEEAQDEPVPQTEQAEKKDKPSQNLDWVVRKHLEYMKDPFKIAAHVKHTLGKNRYDEALALTREASKNAQCVVSWNHLIGYQMEQQRLHAAIKLFNEVSFPWSMGVLCRLMDYLQMKKRAQMPNAQTYTIIFRGCAKSLHPKLAVSEAIKLYHSMTKSSRLEPNTIHLNAVMQVCARAEDLASMFSILETADKPVRSPNGQTYTIVLNALREQSAKPRLPGGVDDEEIVKRNRLQAVSRAKVVWDEVTSRWRKGQIIIDEELACAMGRVLLNGDHRDLDSILSLVEQTMNISRIDKDQIVPQQTGKKLQDNTYGYVVPGRNALSLVMKALARLRRSNLAPKYWQVFTEDYRIIPDADNWFSYLGVCAKAGASAKAAEIIQMMPMELLTPKTYRLAFKVCVKDNLNVHAFDNANMIFDEMARTLKSPDCESLKLYLQAALGNHRKFKLLEETGDPSGSKFARGEQIVQALDRLWEPLKLAQNALAYPDINTRSPEEEWARTYDDRAQLIGLSRMIVAAIDKLLSEGMVSPELIKVLKTRRNILNRQVARHYEKYHAMKGKSKGKEEQKPAKDGDQAW